MGHSPQGGQELHGPGNRDDSLEVGGLLHQQARTVGDVLPHRPLRQQRRHRRVPLPSVYDLLDFLPLLKEGDSYGSRRRGFCFITDCPPGELR